jgi:A/G-specific adenine glycosylase
VSLTVAGLCRFTRGIIGADARRACASRESADDSAGVWHGRDLPWRNTTDPYHVLVSEVMLQQTQVDRVMPKYHEWLAKFPSFEALAAADERDVSATWRPLGYNIRPKRLHSIAKESVAVYASLPWMKRPLVQGSGPIRELSTFAFGQRAAIDATWRVLYRVFIARRSQSHATWAGARGPVRSGTSTTSRR